MSETNIPTASTFISSNEVGSAIVVARSGEAVTSKRIDFIPVEGRYLYLSANPTTLVADGTSQSILTAVVVDSLYRPVSDGIPIFFYSFGSGRLERRTVLTSGGIASVNLTSGTITGKDTVIALLTREVADTVIITFVPGPPASIQFTTPPHNIDAGGDTTSFVVRVLDRFSNPVLAGTRVTFETTLGTITTYAVTDTSGYARGTLTSGTAMGIAFITARSGDAIGYVTVNIMATAADTLILSANPLTIVANGRDSSIITATVLDDSRLPVSDGTLVRFSTTKGILSSPAVYTVGGIARTALISTITAPDTAIVRASAGSGVVDTVHVAFRAGPPAIVEVSSSRPTIVADGLDTATITIRVKDEFSNSIGAGERVDL
ncbi:MAG: invasin domain 3-containing protein, partial [bacterium]